MATEYLLAMASNPAGLPLILGAVAAEGVGDAIFGEAVVGEGDGTPLEHLDATVRLLRGLNAPQAVEDAGRWLERISGSSVGTVRLVGPFVRDCEAREVLHWTMSEVGLRARAVASVRGCSLRSLPAEKEA